MKDINTSIQEALKEINFDEIAKDVAVKSVQQAVKKAVEDQLTSYSGFGEELKKHIKSQLAFDITQIKLPTYRDFLIDAVNTSLASFTTTEHAKLIQDYIAKEVVGESRDEIEFSKFWDELCEMVNDSCDSGEYSKYNIECKKKDNSWSSSRDYWEICITLNESDIGYRKEKKKVLEASISDGQIYYLYDNDSDRDLRRVATWFSALKFRKTKLTDIDREEVDVPQEP